jgi:hypothetical protein
LWVIAIVMGVTILILLVCCIPLEVTFYVQAAGRPEFRVRVLWSFGLVQTERATHKTPQDTRSRVDAAPKAQKREMRASTVLQLLKIKGLITQLWRLLLGILRCLRLKELKADLRIGLDDPADTGLLFALIGPAAVLVCSIWPDQIRVMPSFEDEAVFEGYAHGTVSMQPIRLIPPVVRVIFSLPTLNVLKALILNLWKKQK